MDNDEGLLWQEVLDEVAAGRIQNLKCPFCQKGQVLVTEKGQVTRIECSGCRRFVEGQMR